MERTFGKITWLDYLKPSEKNLEDIRRRFKLHEIIVDELREPSARYKVEIYGDLLFLVYYFPVFDPKEQTSRRSEIDFLISKDTVLTVHYEEVEPLKQIKEEYPEFKTPFELVYRIISTILIYQDRQLRHIRDKVEGVGAILFAHKEREVLRMVSRLKRDISEYRIVSRHQGPILEGLSGKGLKFFGNAEANRPYMDDLIGEHSKVLSMIEDYRDAIMDYDHTNNQLLNLRINEAMKTFTILSFLTFPFVLLVSFVDMNVTDNPLRNIPGIFWMIGGVIVIGMASLYTYFRNRNWL